MRGIQFLCFVLAIPALAALGHDIYLTYQDQDFTRTMMFSNLSYLWTHYSPDTYIWTMKNADPELWKNIIVPVLRCYTIIAAAAPAICVYTLLILLKVFNLPPFRDVSVRGGHKKGSFGFKSSDPVKSQFKYKRK